jgi:hypothetical protein
LEVQEVINSLNPKKFWGYDLNAGESLKELFVRIKCYLAERLLPGTVESCTDHPLLEAKES